MEKKEYRVGHTMDELGGSYSSSVIPDELYTLAGAKAEAQRLTGKGQCGYVVRAEDWAVLAPDGTWISEE